MSLLRLALSACAFGLAATTSALGAWSVPERASAGPLPAAGADVAMNARGDAVAAWGRGTGGGRAIVATVRPVGGEWTRPGIISPPGGAAIDPRVAVAADGRVVVVWRQAVGARTVIARGRPRTRQVYAVRARDLITGARWGPVATLSSARQSVGRAVLGIDDSGMAVAAWHWGTGTRPTDPGFVSELQFAESGPGQAWASARRAARSRRCTTIARPRVAVGPAGHVAVWWVCLLRGGRSVAFAAARGPDEGFGAERPLSLAGAGLLSADLAIAPDGRAVAVGSDGARLRWWRGPVSRQGIALAELPALSSAERLGRGAGVPRIAAGPSGDVLSAWIDPFGRIRAAPIAPDLGVATPATVGADPAAARVQVAVGDGRRGVVAWTAGGRVLAATRDAAGIVGAVTVLSAHGVPRGQSPAIAVDAAGDAIAYWTRVVRGRSIVERAGLAAP